MPRGAIQPMKRPLALRQVRAQRGRERGERAGPRGPGRRPGRAWAASRCRSDCGVTVAEMEMNSRPMISWTSVSKNGRRAGMSKPRRLARARPMKIAAMSPVSSRTTSHPAATPITAASCAVVPSSLAEPELAEQQPEQRGADDASGQADPDAEPQTARSGCPGPCGCSRRRRGRPARRGCRRPGRSVTLPRSGPAAAVPSAGRNSSSGPTTVGPETTRITPSISAAPRDMPSSGAATSAASTQVISTPEDDQADHTLRVWPLSLRRSRPRPAS